MKKAMNTRVKSLIAGVAVVVWTMPKALNSGKYMVI